MIGYCKGNIFKYEFRKFNKGALEEDEKKIETYKKYLKELEDMNYLSLGNYKVVDAIRMTHREWIYRIKDCITCETNDADICRSCVAKSVRAGEYPLWKEEKRESK